MENIRKALGLEPKTAYTEAIPETLVNNDFAVHQVSRALLWVCERQLAVGDGCLRVCGVCAGLCRCNAHTETHLSPMRCGRSSVFFFFLPQFLLLIVLYYRCFAMGFQVNLPALLTTQCSRYWQLGRRLATFCYILLSRSVHYFVYTH